MTIQKYENEINTILEEIKEMEARTDDVDDFLKLVAMHAAVIYFDLHSEEDDGTMIEAAMMMKKIARGENND